MLDIEFLGIIIAVGILLAFLFLGLFFINMLKDTLNLAKKYKDDEDEQIHAYIKSQKLKTLLLAAGEIVLVGCLALVKIKMF